MRTNIVPPSSAGAKVIDPRRTIIGVAPFVGWVKEFVGKCDPVEMPKIVTGWKILQSGFVVCDTEFEDLTPTQECTN